MRWPQLTAASMPAGAVVLAAVLAAPLTGIGGVLGGDGAGPEAGQAFITAASQPPEALPARAAPTGPVAMPPSVPVRVQIPAIGVDSELMDLGLKPDGTLEVPPEGFPAGWYTGAPTPGEVGPAIIAGHVDWSGPGVFYDLHRLRPDDQVTVQRADGSAAVFRITRVEQYSKDAFPTEEVYGDVDHAGLRLITCGGVFNRVTGSHDDNIVVFAELVEPGWP